MQNREYLTTAEVCDYLRLKERAVYELVARRAIPCSRATGKLLFPKRLIDRWLESRLDPPHGHLAEPPPIVAGSSDPLLDWALRESASGLAALSEGSGAGLERFAAGQAVAVGLHILVPDGSYNVESVRAVAAFADTVLLQWAWREQGLVVGAGNPLGLSGVVDLAAKAPRIVLRQPGSGAEILLDALLRQAGVDRAALNCADRRALTEADAAAAVADGSADCALAIGAAARRLGLHFVPLHRERFDLALRRRSFFEPPLQRLFGLARSEAFRQRADSFGWYDVNGVGTIQFNG